MIKWVSAIQLSGWVIINGDGGCSILAAYRRAYGSSRSAWSKGRQPPGRCSASIAWTGWTLAMTKSWWQHHKDWPRYYYYYYYYYYYHSGILKPIQSLTSSIHHRLGVPLRLLPSIWPWRTAVHRFSALTSWPKNRNLRCCIFCLKRHFWPNSSKVPILIHWSCGVKSSWHVKPPILFQMLLNASNQPFSLFTSIHANIRHKNETICTSCQFITLLCSKAAVKVTMIERAHYINDKCIAVGNSTKNAKIERTHSHNKSVFLTVSFNKFSVVHATSRYARKAISGNHM